MHFFKVLASTLLVASVSAATLPFGYCNDLSKVELPVDSQNATNRLPPPAPGLKLVRVAFGLGTQNYSCADRSKPPAQVGALAKLYDADPFACQPKQLAEWTRALVQASPSTQVMIASTLTRMFNKDIVVGEHFFTDAKTPTFDFDLNNKNKGIFYSKLDSKIPAPKGSCKGRAPLDNGAVPWLKLNLQQGYKSSGYQEAYRVYTAGGTPPATCDGQKETFEIPYTAFYYLYN